MTLRERYGATMQDPWWHLCSKCRKLHVADAAISKGAVVFGLCQRCLCATHVQK